MSAWDHDEGYMDAVEAEARARGTCAVTGQPFSVEGEGFPFSPSPDRLDNSEGYVRGHGLEGRQGNVIWVLACVNRARSDYRIEDLERAGVLAPTVADAYRRIFAEYEAAKAEWAARSAS